MRCYSSAVIVTITSDVITMENVIGFNVLGLYFSGLQLQANQTNSYLQRQADHLNDVSLHIFHSK